MPARSPALRLCLTLSVDGAFALELSEVVSSDHQPLVLATLEAQASRFEPELGVAARDVGALLVLGDEAKVGSAGEWLFEIPGGSQAVDGQLGIVEVAAYAGVV